MLIDASHPEETRVVVVDGTRLEDFDYEMASRKPLKGNIYLAKVIRIEPSLQAAFVEYGGNRHGFLAFSEIHPDYFQIPIADREKLIAEEQRLAEEEQEPSREPQKVDRTDIEEVREENREAIAEVVAEAPVAPEAPEAEHTSIEADPALTATEPSSSFPPPSGEMGGGGNEESPLGGADETAAVKPQAAEIHAESVVGPREDTLIEESTATVGEPSAATDLAEAPQPETTPVEVLGGDDGGVEHQTRERRRRHPVRQYKIQEVIKRRQILLVQVVKEERGNKGAALTTYLSLAGRYCVLMPNAGRGGGISRKISNPNDRKRMKEMLAQLEVPQGMGVILRTAGLERSNLDIKRDYEYLSRLWDSIRELTMRSTAPALIYEEGDLVKRSLRDVYDTDIQQVLVEGDTGYEAASEFMRQLMPHEAGKVQRYDEPIPLFHRYQVESQFDAMHSPVVQLRSGGYIVINPTEALVAIDVNSGRATKERNIEETALRTNVEAAEEIARQVRLRDLAGLIVIDFIDMEENRHQRQVEHKVKDAMRNDRARIQIGRISAFGLLEMSRQRLRPSLLEHSTEICPHCAGTGRVRSIESAALHALRAIEEEGVRRRASEILVGVPPQVALYILNHKRYTLSEIEKRYGFTVVIEADDELHAADCEIERVRSRREDHHRPAQETARASYDDVEAEAAEGEAADVGEPAGTGEMAGDEQREDRGEDEAGRRRRRRRRRRGRRDHEERGFDGREDGEEREAVTRGDGDEAQPAASADDLPDRDSEDTGEPRGGVGEYASPANEQDGDGSRFEGGDRRRRRGRRGGRRRRRENGDGRTEAWDQLSDRPSHADQPGSEFPVEHMPVEDISGQHMSVERPEFVPVPTEPNAMAPVPPPEPIVAPAPQLPVVAAAPQPAEEVPLAPPPAAAVPTISTDTPPEKPKRGWWRRG
jgi:ribonuclease E